MPEIIRTRTAGRRWRVVGAALLACALMTGTSGAAHASPQQVDGGGAGTEPQEPFLCTTQYSDLGQPIVDNQDREGTPVYPESAPDTPDLTQDPIGWSKQCQANERVEYRYVDTNGDRQTLSADATELPADIAYLDEADLVGTDDMAGTDADRIPYLYRYQRGTLPETRFIYSIAMLVPFDEVTDGSGDWDHSLWNGRLVYSFGGGVGIGHSQGSLSGGDSQLNEALRSGHAVVYSSGTRTSVHYDLLLGGRVATEMKDHFVAEHGDPRYTVGIGGSGGGIQQYVYAQNHPDLLDALIPQYSYPDMTTQTINIGDCELLEYYMDEIDGDNERWSDWDNRRLLQGQNTIEGFTSDWQEVTGASGSSECIEGWRGSTPLALNPTFGLAAGMDDALIPFAGELLTLAGSGEPAVPEDFPDLGRLLRQSPDDSEWVNWTHWDDAAAAYGIDPDTGFAREPWDNVGVQYGLRSVANGDITPEEFLDLNQRVGSWTKGANAVPESCGMVKQIAGDALGELGKTIGICEGDELDQYSARQMWHAADGFVAPRAEGDVEAITNAFESGLEFDGELGRDVPILDIRHYLEHELDMHNVHQSFVVRERIERAMGASDNQIIWFMDARPERNDDVTSELLLDVYKVMDEWVLAMAEDGSTAAEAKPANAVDGCWATDGTEIASGSDVWDGAVELVTTGEGAWSDEAPSEVDGVTVGDCAAEFPMHSTSRVVAGGPITNDIYKCHTKDVSQAIDDGDYGGWSPTDEEVERLETIFADGVCDWSQPSVGYPEDRLAARPAAGGSFVGDVIQTDDSNDAIWQVLLGLGIGTAALAGAYVAFRGQRRPS